MQTHLLNNMRTSYKALLCAFVLSFFWLASTAAFRAVSPRMNALVAAALKPTTSTATTKALVEGEIKIEAEAATLNGVDIVTTLPGYSGTGYAWNFIEDTDNVVFSVPATAGKYMLTIRYYSPYGEKHTNVQVNGGPVIDQTLADTKEAFGTATVGEVTLVAGQNTISLTKFYGYYGIDFITLTPVTSGTPTPPAPPVTPTTPQLTKLEAESATLNGVDAVTTLAGYSGTGYAWNFIEDTDNVAFTFPAAAGKYILTIRYYSPFGEKHTNVQVNAGAVIDQTLVGTGEAFSTASVGEVTLVAGQNTVTLTKSYGYYGIDFITLTPVVAVATPQLTKVEAETATLNGVSAVTTVAGYSGTGYVWNFDNAADNIVFTVPAIAGEYEMSVIYYSPYGEKHTFIQVNSAPQTEHIFTGTGEGFGSLVIGKYQLVAGDNKITLNNGWGYYGIDYILLKPVSAVQPPVVVHPLVNGRLEAELGVRDGTDLATTPTGFSGTGYVTGFDGATDKVTLSFSATAGLYDMTLGYTSPFGEKSYEFQLNDERGSGMFVNTGATFSTANAGKALLKEGVNTLTITRGWGYYGIDYAQFTPTTVALPVKPPKTLSDPNATPSTKGLFSYLVDQYGSKTLSGQHDDIEYVFQTTGKMPAVAAYDLMDLSPSRVARGTNINGQSERNIAWAKGGDGNGIVSLIWHWNAPTDLIDLPPDRLWWSGFYTRATTFDLAAALADKNGANYKLLIRDMDVIAEELKKFKDADVPVLWRPLHESAGAFFWWGAKGPEPLKELWRIMHDRFTNYHQLHNLIWVYTGLDTFNLDWYPGDAYVDVVSLDIYADASSNMSGNWANIKTPFDGKKLVALSETGNPPKPDNVRAFATWWSWFAPWTGDYIRNQPVELLKAIYNDRDVITRDELPNWRVYDQTTPPVSGTLALAAPAYNCQTGAITFKTTGGDGTPVEYRAIGVTDWTTNPNAVIDGPVRGDGNALTLMARQSGQVVTSTFDFRAFCTGQGTNQPPVFNGPMAPQSATVGVAFSYQIPASMFTDPENGAIVMTATNLPAGMSFNAGTRTISGTPTTFGSVMVTLTATDPQNAAVSGTLMINMGSANGTQPFALIQPTYNCQTGAITFRTSGGDGTPIEFRAVGVTDWTTNPNAVVDGPVRGDGNALTLTARQNGNVVSMTFDFRAYCSALATSRLSAETLAPVQVRVLGNPVNDRLTVEITGADGQALDLNLTDVSGRLVEHRMVERASAAERQVFDLQRQTTGMLILSIGRNGQTQRVKLIKQ